jgi:3-isopropylmalate dehydratase
VIEFSGPVIEGLSMESRMSLCNMSIEAGARAGLIAPDEKTFAYVKQREMAPSTTWDIAEAYWKTLRTDIDAVFDKVVHINADDVSPTITWGTSPEQVVPITGVVPAPSEFLDLVKKESCRQALAYMGLTAGTLVADIQVDKVFIGSCTNARIEDFRAAAQILRGQTIAPNIKLALAVPGSGLVKRAAEDEGIDIIFKRAGFQWREAGCSMCVGLNEDSLAPTERCASTSNRNFESRQGTAGRTHLVSPVVAAATAIKGTLAAPSQVGKAAESASRLQHVNIDVDAAYSSDSETLSDEDSSSQTSLISSLSESSGPPNKIKRVWTTVKNHVKEHHDSMNQAYSVYYGQGGGRRSSAASGTAHPKQAVEQAAPQSIDSPRFEDGIKGSVAIIERANIDTDAIFPKQFCTTTQRTGLGHALFSNLRFHSDGSPKPDFVLNRPESRNASILLATGPNFGCGSSREHAVWALQDFGFRCVIAPSFADIFYNNAFKNSLLLAKVEADVVERIVAESSAGKSIKISLEGQTIRTDQGADIGGFGIPERRKQELLSGIGEIEASLAFQDQIKRYEELRRQLSPWYEEGVHPQAIARQRRLARGQSNPFRDGHKEEDLTW